MNFLGISNEHLLPTVAFSRCSRVYPKPRLNRSQPTSHQQPYMWPLDRPLDHRGS